MLACWFGNEGVACAPDGPVLLSQCAWTYLNNIKRIQTYVFSRFFDVALDVALGRACCKMPFLFQNYFFLLITHTFPLTLKHNPMQCKFKVQLKQP